MSDTKDASHNGVDPIAKPSKKRKCLDHCKRFWWAHLIVFICIVILVVCLVIFVGVPNIAQDKINDAKLEIQGVNILDTEPNKYRMEVNSTITTDGSIQAKVDGFTGRMYLEDLDGHPTFATLDFPETSAAKHQQVNVSQEVTIADMDAFTTFNVWFTKNENVKVTIEGETKVKPQGLDRKSSVNFKKTLDLKGLNLFKGTTVDPKSAKLSFGEGKDGGDGKNFHGEADIPNASVFTLDIGNVTFTNFIEEEKVGTLWIENLVLHPGSNKVKVSASMDQEYITKKLTSKPYCKEGIIPFKLLGEKVTNHNQDISYFAKALGSANQTIDMDIGRIVGGGSKSSGDYCIS